MFPKNCSGLHFLAGKQQISGYQRLTIVNSPLSCFDDDYPVNDINRVIILCVVVVVAKKRSAPQKTSSRRATGHEHSTQTNLYLHVAACRGVLACPTNIQNERVARKVSVKHQPLTSDISLSIIRDVKKRV